MIWIIGILSDNFQFNMALFSASLNYFYRVKKQYRARGVIPLQFGIRDATGLFAAINM